MSSVANIPKKTMGLQVFHKGLILVAAPLIIEITLIVSLALLLAESDRESVRENRFRQASAHSAKLMQLANEAVIAAFAAYQGDPQFFIKLFDQDRTGMEDRKRALRACSQGNREAEQAAEQLITSIDDLSPILDEVIAPARHGTSLFGIAADLHRIQDKFGQKREVTMQRMSIVTQMQEQMAEDSRKRSATLQNLQFQILAVGLTVNVLAGLALVYFYRTSITSRLKSIMSNTLRLAEGYELLPQIGGADEIAQLDQSFHKMHQSLKDAADRERLLLESANDVICVLDADLKFCKINPACLRVWGYAEDELLLHSVSQILGENKEEIESALSKFRRARETNEQQDIESSVYGPSGKKIETLWSIYFAEEENVLYCVVHDITERKQLEHNKHAFISMMSSDLREPLFRISSNVETLVGSLQNELSSKAISRLESIKSNGARLLSLVNELLELTDSETEQQSANRQIVALKPILERAIADLEGMAQKSKIKFEIECDATTCYADPNKIIQVLVNLGSNSIKFSPQDSCVTLIAREEEEEYIRVSVLDKGRGIPEEHRMSVFEKFKQVDARDGKAKAGTGLGLPICKDIIESSGGKIYVESKEGVGSEFVFTLPKNEAIFSNWENQQKLIVKAKAESAATARSQAFPVISQTTKSAGSKLSLFQKGALLIGVPILFELIFVVSITTLLIQTQKSRVEESRQRQIAQTAYRLLDAYFTNCVTVIHIKTKKQWFEYDKLNEHLIDSGNKLKRLVRHDAKEAELFGAAEKLHDRMVSHIEASRRALEENGYTKNNIGRYKPDRYELWATSTGISKRVGKLIDEAERREFINPQKQNQLRELQGIALNSGLLFNLLLSLFLARFFSRDITSRLAIQADNASRVARELPLNPVVEGSDEISKLDKAFHDTAEKLAAARKKERAILDNSRDLICILDNQGRFLSSNPAAEDILSCNKDDLRNQSIFNFVEKDDSDIFTRFLSSELSSAENREIKIRSSDGKMAYMLVSLSRTSEQNYLYCIAHDITARKELEQLKEEFLAVVSHDLRSPLTSMTGTAALIHEGATGPVGANARPLLEDIIYQSEVLIELINDLLDLEKIESGKMTFVRSEVSSAECLEKSCEIAQSRQYEVEIDLREALDEITLFLEFERIVQAVSNLITLSAARLPAGATVQVSAEYTTEHVLWCIKDNGEQFTEEEISGLFDRQASANLISNLLRRKTANHSVISSLHLSILSPVLSYRVISAHGGSLEYHRDREEMNALIVKLPLKQASTGSNIEK